MKRRLLLITCFMAVVLTVQAQTVTYTIGGKTETKSITDLADCSLNRATDITLKGEWTEATFRKLAWVFKEDLAHAGNAYLRTIDMSGMTFAYDSNYYAIFSHLTELTDIKMPTQEIPYAFDFTQGFRNCAKLNTKLDLSMFTNITAMGSCFEGCAALPSITLCNNLNSVTNWDDAFNGVKNGFILWLKGNEADTDLGVLPMVYRSLVKYTASSEKKRNMTLDLSKVTTNDNSMMETEGWAWYYTATDKYPAKTLLMDNCNIIIPNATNDNYGVTLPDGATIQLASGSENIISLGTSTKSNVGIYALGSLTIGQADGTGKLTVKSDKAESANHGILISKGLTQQGDTVSIIGGQTKIVYGIYIIAGDGTFNGGTLDIDISATSAQGYPERYGIFSNAKVNINGGNGTINCDAQNGTKKNPITGTITTGTGMVISGETDAPIRSWKNTTGINNKTVDAGFSIISGKGSITITAQAAQTIQVVAIDGYMVRAVSIESGETQTIDGLATGLYIANGQKAIVY